MRDRQERKGRRLLLREWSVAALLGLALAACGIGGGERNAAAGDEPEPAVASSRTDRFDASLRDRPCEVVTRDTVAAAFAVVAEDIEQSSMSSLCGYRWEADDTLLDVTVHVSAVAEDPAAAAVLFEQATSDASGERFEDIGSLGDQAREDIRNGDIHVRDRNLYFTLNAYYGPDLPLPVPPSAATTAESRAQWLKATLPLRQQATARLARRSVEDLEPR